MTNPSIRDSMPPFCAVWERVLREAAAGLDVVADPEDRATFRGAVGYKTKNLKWSGMVDVARHLGATGPIPRNRARTAKIIADRWVARLRRRVGDKPSPLAIRRRFDLSTVEFA